VDKLRLDLDKGTPETIRLRGHTLLCLQGFRGKGYNAEFVANLARIHRELTDDPDRWIEVVDTPDAVCGACPHRAPSGCSLNDDHSEEVIQAQDRRVLDLLGLNAGMKVRWGRVLDLIRASVSGSSLPDICGQCRWLPLGYCRDGIERLRKEANSK
jgi:hypothetical protein